MAEQNHVVNEHLSKAVLFFDLFAVHNDTKRLKQAHESMKKYRASGGDLYTNLEAVINGLVIFHGLTTEN